MSNQGLGTRDAEIGDPRAGRPRVRRVAVASAASALVITGLAMGLDAQLGAAAAPRAAAACTPLKPTKSERIDANGRSVRATRLDASKYAVKKYYRLGDIDFTTVVPPTGFDPATAAVSTLHAYGYEDLPIGRALTRWRANNGHKFRSVESEPCVGSPQDNVSRAPRPVTAASQSVTPLTSFTSVNWGGFIDGGYNDFTSASLSAAQITYDGYCGDPNASSAAVWAGLGGKYTRNLLQSGYWAGLFQMRDVNGNPIWDSLNGSTLFWEAINQPYGEPPVFIGADHAGAGAILHTRVSYVPSTGHATFTWSDLTTGYTWTPVTITDGSHFYDGSTADFITEDREGTNLRHYAPSLTQTFTDATAGTGGNGAEYGVFSYPGWQQALLQDLNGNNLLADHIVSGSDRSYIQTWKGCN